MGTRVTEYGHGTIAVTECLHKGLGLILSTTHTHTPINANLYEHIYAYVHVCMTCTYKHKIEFNQQFTPYLIFPFFFFTLLRFQTLIARSTEIQIYIVKKPNEVKHCSKAKSTFMLHSSHLNCIWCKPCYLTREQRLRQRGRKRGKNHRKKKVMNFRLLPLVRLPPQARE